MIFARRGSQLNEDVQVNFAQHALIDIGDQITSRDPLLRAWMYSK